MTEIEAVRESYTIVDDQEKIIGFVIDDKIDNIHRFLQVDRKPDGIRLWLNKMDFDNDQNPTALGIMLSVEEARHLGLTLLEQAFALEMEQI